MKRQILAALVYSLTFSNAVMSQERPAEPKADPKLEIVCQGSVKLANGKVLDIKEQTFSLEKISDKADEYSEYQVRARMTTEDKSHGARLRATLTEKDGKFLDLRVIYQFERKEKDSTITVLALAEVSADQEIRKVIEGYTGDIHLKSTAYPRNPELATSAVNWDKNPDKGIEAGILPTKRLASKDVMSLFPSEQATDAMFDCSFTAPKSQAGPQIKIIEVK